MTSWHAPLSNPAPTTLHSTHLLCGRASLSQHVRLQGVEDVEEHTRRVVAGVMEEPGNERAAAGNGGSEGSIPGAELRRQTVGGGGELGWTPHRDGVSHRSPPLTRVSAQRTKVGRVGLPRMPRPTKYVRPPTMETAEGSSSAKASPSPLYRGGRASFLNALREHASSGLPTAGGIMAWEAHRGALPVTSATSRTPAPAPALGTRPAQPRQSGGAEPR